MSERPMSPIRREIAQAVRDGKVSYAPARAEWTLDGELVTGWRGRTLREMFTEGLVMASIPTRIDGSTVVKPYLSAEGTAAMRRAAELDAEHAARQPQEAAKVPGEGDDRPGDEAPPEV